MLNLFMKHCLPQVERHGFASLAVNWSRYLSIIPVWLVYENRHGCLSPIYIVLRPELRGRLNRLQPTILRIVERTKLKRQWEINQRKNDLWKYILKEIPDNWKLNKREIRVWGIVIVSKIVPCNAVCPAGAEGLPLGRLPDCRTCWCSCWRNCIRPSSSPWPRGTRW